MRVTPKSNPRIRRILMSSDLFIILRVNTQCSEEHNFDFFQKEEENRGQGQNNFTSNISKALTSTSQKELKLLFQRRRTRVYWKDPVGIKYYIAKLTPDGIEYSISRQKTKKILLVHEKQKLPYIAESVSEIDKYKGLNSVSLTAKYFSVYRHYSQEEAQRALQMNERDLKALRENYINSLRKLNAKEEALLRVTKYRKD